MDVVNILTVDTSKLEVRSIDFILKEEKIGILRDQMKEIRLEAIDTGPIPLSPYLVLIMFTWIILRLERSTDIETLCCNLSIIFRNSRFGLQYQLN